MLEERNATLQAEIAEAVVKLEQADDLAHGEEMVDVNGESTSKTLDAGNYLFVCGCF